MTSRKYALRMPGFSRAFSSSYSRLVHIVVQVTWLPEVTPSGFHWVCACATGSCAISTLMGHFDRKWRYETSPRSDQRSRGPLRGSLGWAARMRDRKCLWDVLCDVCVYHFLALIIICPFPAILLAPSIMVFTYGYVLQVVYHVLIPFLLYFQRSWRFLIPSSNFRVYSTC